MRWFSTRKYEKKSQGGVPGGEEDDRREERGRGLLAMVRIDRRYLQRCGPPTRNLSSLAARFEERWGGE
jgi:hypothetical protein